jgi:lysozyme
VENEALELAAALCRRFEGLFLAPYLCPAGVPTIGYGSTRYPSGRRVALSDARITREQAAALMMHEMRAVCLPAVRRICPGADTPGRMAALLDFCYNLGAGNLAASTLRRRVNDGDWIAARRELMRWTKANGRDLRGLVLRRAAEAELFVHDV